MEIKFMKHRAVLTIITVLMLIIAKPIKCRIEQLIPDIPIKPNQFLVPPRLDAELSSVSNKNSTGAFILSANVINPAGFDFTKVTKAVTRKTYKQMVIPLLWVNLPHFDLPVFRSNSGNEIENSSNDVMKSINQSRRIQIPFLNNYENAKQNNSNKSTTSNSTTEKLRKLKIDKDSAEDNGKKVNVGRTVKNFPDPILVAAESKHQVSQKISDFEPSTQRPFRNLKSSAPTMGHGDHSSSTTTASNTSPLETSESSNANYNFAYSVSNPETQDVKSHFENRVQNVVRGEYTVLEADGYTRVVKYTADASGFKATVKRIPPGNNLTLKQ